MRLKPQTYYRTRDGRKAFVSGKNPFREGDYPWVGWVDGDNNRCTWSDYGRWDAHGGTGYDLIAVWTDRPAEEDGWEIVDDPEAVAERGWDWWNGSKWIPVIGLERCTPDYCEQWVWFRRPVPPPAPREWWHLLDDDGDLEGVFDCEESAIRATTSYAKQIVHVREVIEPKETT